MSGKPVPYARDGVQRGLRVMADKGQEFSIQLPARYRYERAHAARGGMFVGLDALVMLVECPATRRQSLMTVYELEESWIQTSRIKMIAEPLGIEIADRVVIRGNSRPSSFSTRLRADENGLRIRVSATERNLSWLVVPQFKVPGFKVMRFPAISIAKGLDEFISIHGSTLKMLGTRLWEKKVKGNGVINFFPLLNTITRMMTGSFRQMLEAVGAGPDWFEDAIWPIVAESIVLHVVRGLNFKMVSVAQDLWGHEDLLLGFGLLPNPTVKREVSSLRHRVLEGGVWLGPDGPRLRYGKDFIEFKGDESHQELLASMFGDRCHVCLGGVEKKKRGYSNVLDGLDSASLFGLPGVITCIQSRAIGSHTREGFTYWSPTHEEGVDKPEYTLLAVTLDGEQLLFSAVLFRGHWLEGEHAHGTVYLLDAMKGMSVGMPTYDDTQIMATYSPILDARDYVHAKVPKSYQLSALAVLLGAWTNVVIDLATECLIGCKAFPKDGALMNLGIIIGNQKEWVRRVPDLLTMFGSPPDGIAEMLCWLIFGPDAVGYSFGVDPDEPDNASFDLVLPGEKRPHDPFNVTSLMTPFLVKIGAFRDLLFQQENGAFIYTRAGLETHAIRNTAKQLLDPIFLQTGLVFGCYLDSDDPYTVLDSYRVGWDEKAVELETFSGCSLGCTHDEMCRRCHELLTIEFLTCWKRNSPACPKMGVILNRIAGQLHRKPPVNTLFAY